MYQPRNCHSLVVLSRASAAVSGLGIFDEGELVMPALDLINGRNQGGGRVGQADPSISSGSTRAATHAGDFAADLLQEQQNG